MELNLAAKRLKLFHELSIFEQKPFKYTLYQGSNGSYDYQIYDSENRPSHVVHFTKFENSKGDEGTELEFENNEGTHIITNNSRDIVFRLFNTIIQILQEYTKTVPFNYIAFSADITEPSRVRLYDALYERFKKIYSTYYRFYTKKIPTHSLYIFAKKELEYNPMHYIYEDDGA